MSLIRLCISFISFIVKGVLISVITSVALFIIGLSVVTQKFPPDLSAYQDDIAEARLMLKAFTDHAGKVKSQSIVMQPPQGPEKLLDTDEMIRVHENKIQLGREIAGIVAPVAQTASQLESKREIEKLRQDVDYLKGRVLELENQISTSGKSHSN